ncbi:APC family permease [Alteribacillus bidgolensis]|uniref:Amino acid/polyamine/organocation transporter, APC superfamily n=1 Tax=Alteribacillus bidgolensis TaxID=930129 RepID=A0A1G8ICV5_9BACI|nr:APC family permease [Alteribacillus bidgolensis]SDI16848.1 amino acid/polyamine/organocation transporter, APC superfamily [Alteribacillus bidgolensis]
MTNQLKRSLGLWAAVAAAVGIVVSSSAMVSLGEGFGIGGQGFIFAMVFALVLNLCVAFTFAELSGILPRAGGLNRYTLPAMGSFIGMIAVISGYVLVTIFAGSAEAGIAGLVFSEVFSIEINSTIISISAVVILGLVNIFGVKFFSWTQIVLTTLLIASTVILGIIGLTGIGSGEPLSYSLDFNPMGWGVLSLTALAFWLFVGIEFVTPLAEEIKKPKVYIPLSMVLGLGIIFAADLLFGFAAIKYVSLNNLAESASPHVVAAEAILGQTGLMWMGIVTVLATASTLNTLISAISRMLFAMGQEGEMPKVFSSLNRWGAPWAAIFFLCILFVSFLLIGITNSSSITTFILAGCLCWMIAYIVAHLNVIILRFKYPNVKRGFKSPFGITFQVLGITGMLYIIFNIFPDPEIKAQIYKYTIVFLAITVIYAIWWIKFVMKKKLFETIPLEDLLDESSTEIENESPDAKENFNI